MKKTPKLKSPSRVLQFKIELMDSSPLIWRRFLVETSITLDELHSTIQTVMGWWNSHLYAFEIGKKRYGLNDETGELGFIDSSSKRLEDVIDALSKGCFYEYDFGDSWSHKLTLEKILDRDEVLGLVPRCVEGECACPPEDVGGMPGFESFRQAMEKPGSEEFEEMLEWHGSPFKGDSFCPNLVNREIRHLLMFEWKEKPKARRGSMISASPYRA